VGAVGAARTTRFQQRRVRCRLPSRDPVAARHAEYEQNHKEAQRIFGEQLPVAPLYLRVKLAATRPDMKNFIMDSTENSEMWNIEEFDIGE